jgi:hypothetical protein
MRQSRTRPFSAPAANALEHLIKPLLLTCVFGLLGFPFGRAYVRARPVLRIGRDHGFRALVRARPVLRIRRDRRFRVIDVRLCLGELGLRRSFEVMCARGTDRGIDIGSAHHDPGSRPCRIGRTPRKRRPKADKNDPCTQNGTPHFFAQLEHFPPKWTPVRRRKCDNIRPPPGRLRCASLRFRRPPSPCGGGMEQADTNRFHIALTASVARDCFSATCTLLLSLPRRGRVAERSEAGWGSNIK